jgi:hypothetical protein
MFRINRGIFQFKDGTSYINKFKIDTDGQLKEVDSDGNPVADYIKTGDKASDADTLDGIDSTGFVKTTYNSSLNGDNRNSRGVTRLYRRDGDSDYSLQHYWTGSYWYLKGYNADTYHAGVQVAYADYAANSNSLDGIDSGSFLRSDASDSFSGNLTATANDWYIYGLGSRGASSGAYGIGNRDADSYRQMTFHVPNQAAYSSSGTIPSFGWYSNGAVQLMKLNSDSGDLWVKGTIEADNRIYADNGLHVRGDWVRVNGNNGIYFESHAGGWHMTDSSWIRAYNSKNIYTGGNIEVAGTSRADNGFKVGGDTAIDSSRNFAAASQITIGNYIIRHDSVTNRLEFVIG